MTTDWPAGRAKTSASAAPATTRRVPARSSRKFREALACVDVMTGLENPTHILFVLIVAVLVLGPKRLPQVGRSLGTGIREFRDSLSGGDEKRGS